MTPGGVWAALLLIGLCLLPLVHLGRRTLWPPDEARYAILATEMAASGDFVVPTYAGKPYIDKPPMFVWLEALGRSVPGLPGETSARLPSVLGAALALLGTYAIGVRLFDRRSALLAALVLATTGRFVLYSQWAATDMLFTGLITIALACAVAGRAAPSGDPDPPVRWPAGAAFFGACAAAVLTKGPAGVVLPAGILFFDRLAALWREPRRFASSLLRLIPAVAAGAAAFLLVAAPWFLLLARRLGAGSIREVLLHQNVDRFLDAWNAQQPWYFYFKVLPMDLLPWTFVLPFLFLPARWIDPGREPAWRFLRVWLGVLFIFFSTASGKSPEYLLPLLPAIALLAARLPAVASGRGLRAGLAAASGAILLLLLAAALLGPRLAAEAGLAGAGALRLPALLVAAGLLGFAIALMRGRAAAAVSILAGAVLLVRGTALAPLMDAGNAVNVAPRVVDDLKPSIEAGRPIGVGRKGADQILYYSGGTVALLDRPRKLEEFLKAGPPRAVILKGREYAAARARLEPLGEVARRWGDEERGFVLLEARPAGAVPADAPESGDGGR